MKTFKRRMYTEQERQVILNFYRQGIKIAMLSKNFGIPDSTIATWVAIDRGFPYDKEPEKEAPIAKTETFRKTENVKSYSDDAEKEDILEAKRHIMDQIKEKSKVSKAEDFVEEQVENLTDELDDTDALFAGYKEGYRDGLNEVFRYLKMIG